MMQTFPTVAPFQRTLSHNCRVSLWWRGYMEREEMEKGGIFSGAVAKERFFYILYLAGRLKSLAGVDRSRTMLEYYWWKMLTNREGVKGLPSTWVAWRRWKPDSKQYHTGIACWYCLRMYVVTHSAMVLLSNDERCDEERISRACRWWTHQW